MSCTVYILRCGDGSFYVGHATDVQRRVAEQKAGRGALFTARRLPVTLVFSERLASEPEAVARERQIKRWTREKKSALIAGDIGALRRASRRRRAAPRAPGGGIPDGGGAPHDTMPT